MNKTLDEALAEKVGQLFEKYAENHERAIHLSLSALVGQISQVRRYKNDDMLDEKAVADYLGVSFNTLQQWRNQGVGIPYVKVGHKTIRYRFEDVLKYVDKNIVKVAEHGRAL